MTTKDYSEHRTNLVVNKVYEALAELEEQGLGDLDEQIGNAIFFRIDDAVITVRVVGVLEEVPDDDEEEYA